METVAGAEKVFDFGAMSYADAKVREKLSAKVCRVKGGPVPAKLTRVRAAQRLVGADLQPGVWSAPRTQVLFLGSQERLLGAHGGQCRYACFVAAGYDPPGGFRSAAAAGRRSGRSMAGPFRQMP